MMNRWIIAAVIVATAGSSRAFADKHSASNEIIGTIPDVQEYTRQTFTQLGITTTAQMSSPDQGESILGKKGNLKIEVRIKKVAENRTHVEVIEEGPKSQMTSRDTPVDILAKIRIKESPG